LTEFDRTPMYGERRLAELWSEVAGETNDRPAKTIVERMMNGTGARDDVAVLALNVREPFERDACGRDVVQRWSLHTDDPFSVVASRRMFTLALRDHGATSEDVAVAEIVFGELVSNAVRYAPGLVDVIVDWSGPDPVLHVLDGGTGFAHLPITPPDLLSESGRGLFIVSALTHDFRMQRRQLVNIRSDALRGSPLPALGNRVGIAAQ
jgi:anti-sigma regulatory factor (Ser/Thr protein kinase)